MKKKSNAFLSLILTLLFILPMFAVPASAEDAPEITVLAEGNCGVMDEENHPTDNVTYKITSDGVLTIRGTGAMMELTSVMLAFDGQPWSAYADQITTLVVKQGVTVITNGCFKNLTHLTSATLADTVTRIGDSAFESCSALYVLTLPNELRSVGNSAFKACSELTSISFPDTVVSFGESVLRECENLRSAVLPKNIPSVRYRTFYNCERLRVVTIPYDVTLIDEGAFYNCDALEDVYYLAPLAKWDSIEISDKKIQAGMTFVDGNKALSHATIHSHFPGGGTSGFTNENVISAPTCGAPAGYDRVEVCGLCCTEIARSWVQTAAPTGNHTPGGQEVSVSQAPTCGAEGVRRIIVTCSECGQTISDTTESIPATGNHTAGTPEVSVVTEATCVTNGLRRIVVKCVKCGNFISETEEVIPATNQHRIVTEIGTIAIAPSCDHESVFPARNRCLDCGTVFEEFTITTPPEPHTPGEPVRENKTDPTCTVPGGYDEVVYCTVCEAEISRTHVTWDPLNHKNAVTVPESAATASEHGFTEGVYCPDCDMWISGHEVIHNTLGERVILREPTATEPGEARIRCTVCGGEGLYAMDPVPAEPGNTEAEGPFARFTKALRGFIDFILRLLKWFGKS